eukprot:GDKJ01025588.1.p1 GENE.GDKJ01025588.1~~GDKJ01025588.1.p1  ORF type:complete len:817 (+),score=121.69 GDKJ01025588.1:112-2451(+)
MEIDEMLLNNNDETEVKTMIENYVAMNESLDWDIKRVDFFDYGLVMRGHGRFFKFLVQQLRFIKKKINSLINDIIKRKQSFDESSPTEILSQRITGSDEDWLRFDDGPPPTSGTGLATNINDPKSTNVNVSVFARNLLESVLFRVSPTEKEVTNLSILKDEAISIMEKIHVIFTSRALRTALPQITSEAKKLLSFQKNEFWRIFQVFDSLTSPQSGLSLAGFEAAVFLDEVTDGLNAAIEDGNLIDLKSLYAQACYTSTDLQLKDAEYASESSEGFIAFHPESRYKFSAIRKAKNIITKTDEAAKECAPSNTCYFETSEDDFTFRLGTFLLEAEVAILNFLEEGFLSSHFPDWNDFLEETKSYEEHTTSSGNSDEQTTVSLAVTANEIPADDLHSVQLKDGLTKTLRNLAENEIRLNSQNSTSSNEEYSKKDYESIPYRVRHFNETSIDHFNKMVDIVFKNSLFTTPSTFSSPDRTLKFMNAKLRIESWRKTLRFLDHDFFFLSVNGYPKNLDVLSSAETSLLSTIRRITGMYRDSFELYSYYFRLHMFEKANLYSKICSALIKAMKMLFRSIVSPYSTSIDRRVKKSISRIGFAVLTFLKGTEGRYDILFRNRGGSEWRQEFTEDAKHEAAQRNLFWLSMAAFALVFLAATAIIFLCKRKKGKFHQESYFSFWKRMCTSGSKWIRKLFSRCVAPNKRRSLLQEPHASNDINGKFEQITYSESAQKRSETVFFSCDVDEQSFEAKWLVTDGLQDAFEFYYEENEVEDHRVEIEIKEEKS